MVVSSNWLTMLERCVARLVTEIDRREAVQRHVGDCHWLLARWRIVASVRCRGWTESLPCGRIQSAHSRAMARCVSLFLS